MPARERPGKNGRKRRHRLFQSETRHTPKRREAGSWRNPSSYEAIRCDGAFEQSLALSKRYNRAGRLSVSSSREPRAKSRFGSAPVCFACGQLRSRYGRVGDYANSSSRIHRRHGSGKVVETGSSRKKPNHWLPIDVLPTCLRASSSKTMQCGTTMPRSSVLPCADGYLELRTYLYTAYRNTISSKHTKAASAVLLELAVGIIPAEHRRVDGRGTYEPEHTATLYGTRAGQTGQAGIDTKVIRVVARPVAPAHPHTTFLTHAGALLLETR
ncbi:hypothetical protein B0T20DRAFT_388753 [Sordaria brevicollis]|uniref:Uncharacterized protein n=1 Tax=Sordaria brevicollis TaxID=83679 RepID=A0AAE0PNP7_SORBR|nr:hypothetical protein B0T20DRAFT_388753 [Sordaria brevicollis]